MHRIFPDLKYKSFKSKGLKGLSEFFVDFATWIDCKQTLKPFSREISQEIIWVELLN